MSRRQILAILLLAAACRGASRGTTVSPANAQRQPAHATTTAKVRTFSIDEPIRVGTIGDSLAYGAGDEAHKGIAGRLKDELRRRGMHDVDTVNLGVNGAQTGDLMSRMKQDRVRKTIAASDVVVLSIGANDLFRAPGARDATLRDPMAVAEKILGRIATIVDDVHAINPTARVLILGGYNPVPKHPLAPLIEPYLTMWDETLAAKFEHDPLVSIVTMRDLVVPEHLSRYDNFHPGGAAYDLAAKRIAKMLMG